MRTCIATFLVAIAVAPAVDAQAVFVTGFESGHYSPGETIDGVDGWMGMASPLVGTIVDGRETASLGRRALTCWGGDPNMLSYEYWPGVFLLDAIWGRDAPEHDAAPVSMARVQADIRLDGPYTAFDALSANLIARNGSWNSSQMWLSSDGNVYCNSYGTDPVTGAQFSYEYEFGTPVLHGQYQRLAIIFDYSVHLAAFEVNGVIVGVLPFGGAGEGGFNGVLLQFAALDDPGVIDPSLYTAYYDNVFHIAVPVGR